MIWATVSSTSCLSCVSSVQSLCHVWLFVTPWTAAWQASLSFTKVCSQSCPLSQWCHATISFSVTQFSSCPQYFPAIRVFSNDMVLNIRSSSGQSIGASASVLPMNIRDWFPLRLTGLISLLSKGLSRVLSNATVQKHQFFSAQPSLWSNSHIHTWLLVKL